MSLGAVKRKSLFPPGPVASKARLDWTAVNAPFSAHRQHQQQQQPQLEEQSEDSASEDWDADSDTSDSSSDEEGGAGDLEPSDWELAAAHCFRDMRLEFMQHGPVSLEKSPVLAA